MLAVILLALGGSRLTGWLRQLGGGQLFGRGGALPDVSRLVEAEVMELADVSPNAVAEWSPGRNPFVYGQPPRPPQADRPPPPPPPPPRQPVAPPPRVDIAEIDSKSVIPEAPTRIPPPPVDFDYIGSFGPAGRRIAVLQTDDTTINARVGDVVREGKFRIHAIGFESLDVTFPGLDYEAPPERVPLRGLDP